MKFIYNPKLEELARQLRNNATKIEDYILTFKANNITPPSPDSYLDSLLGGK